MCWGKLLKTLRPVVQVLDCSDPSDIRLALRPEPYTEYDKRCHFMWFHYRVCGGRGTELCMKIINAGGTPIHKMLLQCDRGEDAAAVAAPAAILMLTQK